jgi:hypothetical protein
MVDVNPDGLSEGEISLKSPRVPAMGANPEKGYPDPIELIESGSSS